MENVKNIAPLTGESLPPRSHFVGTLATVSNALLAVILIFVGSIGYHETVTWSKVLGIAIWLVRLYFSIRQFYPRKQNCLKQLK